MFDRANHYGWVMFASLVLLMAGTFRVFDAIWAFGYDGPLPQSLKHAVLGDSLTVYAWLWLAVGAVLIGAGVSVLYLSAAGRWIGIGAAAIGMLGALPWLPYYPVWSLLYVGLSLTVLYALTVHARPPTAELAV